MVRNRSPGRSRSSRRSSATAAARSSSAWPGCSAPPGPGWRTGSPTTPARPARHPGGRGRPHPPASPDRARRLVPRGGPRGAGPARVPGRLGRRPRAGLRGRDLADELKQRQFRGYEAGDIVGKAGVELTYDQAAAATASRTSRSTPPARVSSSRPPPRPWPRPPAQPRPQPAGECRAGPGRRHAGRPAAARPPAGRHLPASPPPRSLDPGDGALLALASSPVRPAPLVGGISRRDFARYANSPGKPLLHRAVQSALPARLDLEAVRPPWPA